MQACFSLHATNFRERYSIQTDLQWNLWLYTVLDFSLMHTYFYNFQAEKAHK